MSNDLHLVLGGNGFIGQHVVQTLLDNGQRVRLVDRNPAPLFPLQERPDNARLDVRVGDFLDTALIAKALVDVSYVYHFVSTTNPGTSARNPIFDIESNLTGSVRLLEACREAQVKKVIFASSGGTVYGKLHHLPATETHPTDPISAHGVVKLAIEKYLHVFYHLHGLHYSILRIANPYGPGQDPERGQGVVNAFLSRVAQHQPLHVWGKGDVVRDYIYVGDVARAALNAALSDEATGTYNIATGRGHSVNELIQMMFAVSGYDVPVSYEAARAFDVPASILSTERAQTQLNWQPDTPLQTGLRHTWQWIQQFSREGDSDR